jgi:hypothetical protein
LPLLQRVTNGKLFSVTHGEISRDALWVHNAHPCRLQARASASKGRRSERLGASGCLLSQAVTWDNRTRRPPRMRGAGHAVVSPGRGADGAARAPFHERGDVRDIPRSVRIFACRLSETGLATGAARLAGDDTAGEPGQIETAGHPMEFLVKRESLMLASL